VNHRHLLPTEIDLLLDDEEGFGVAPLKAHVRSCTECQLKLEEARVVTDAIDELPHFAPSFRFADAVMAQVPVFVPWHVAARDTVQRWIPRSRPARVAAVALASSVATLLTVAILWISTRTDLLVFATSLAGSRMRELLIDGGRDALAGVLGAQALAVVAQAGAIGMLALAGGFLVTIAMAALGLRAIAVASGRRRTA
jgi:hypothetical protein